jgi:hypothetical protein
LAGADANNLREAARLPLFILMHVEIMNLLKFQCVSRKFSNQRTVSPIFSILKIKKPATFGNWQLIVEVQFFT